NNLNHAAIWKTILALRSLYPFTDTVNGWDRFLSLPANSCSPSVHFITHFNNSHLPDQDLIEVPISTALDKWPFV
ncbi:MAG: hypothetical protein JWQ30_2732, partial [Sediminibacterium sp.]|nr:hypothetical protein [Sediminibacterium sp.]